MTDKLNDPERKREEYLKGIGVKAVKDKDSYVWFPARYEGDWAIPRDWEIPTNFNPSEKAIAKYDRRKRPKLIYEDLAEARYYKWKMQNGGLDTFKEHERYNTLTKGLGIMTRTHRPWPYGWKKILCDNLRAGMSITMAAKKAKIPDRTINRWYSQYPDFKAMLDEAQMDYLRKNLDIINGIAEDGESETNRLNAVKFILERRFKDEYGPKIVTSTEEEVSPMDILMSKISSEMDSGDEDD